VKQPQVEPTLLKARCPDIVPPCHNTTGLKQAADMLALCFNYMDAMLRLTHLKISFFIQCDKNKQGNTTEKDKA